MNKIYYAMSDIHGEIEILKSTIDHCVDLQNENTVLVFCGDYIDGLEDSNSFEVLNYIKYLQDTYGKERIITILGNHDDWFLSWINNKLDILPPVETLWTFIGKEAYSNIVEEAKKEETEDSKVWDKISSLCRNKLLNEYPELLSWMNTSLRLYYETDDQIYVHAGIEEVKMANSLWKVCTSKETYLSKYPPEQGHFYKDIIAGHLEVSAIKKNPYFKSVYYDNANHFYIDGNVVFNRQLLVLKYDESKKVYSSFRKTNQTWEEYIIKRSYK